MTETNTTVQGEIGLLDILVVVAESWIVILIGTLAAAAVGFVYGNLQPTLYSVEGTVELTSFEVQDAIASSSMLQQMQTDGALIVSAVPAATSTTIELTTNSAEIVETARIDLMNTLESAAQNALETRKGQVDTLLLQLQQRTGELDASLERAYAAMEQMEATNSIVGEAYSQLAILTQQLEAERYALAASTVGHKTTLAQLPSDASALLTRITQSSSRRSPIIVAVVAGFVGGFLFLIVAFIRQGFRSASRDPEGRAKLERIKRAFTSRSAP